MVINKIDREHADPHKMHDKVLELLLELNATEEQFNAPFIYASARNGYAVKKIGHPMTNGMTPLFEAIFSTSLRRQPISRRHSKCSLAISIGAITWGGLPSARSPAAQSRSATPLYAFTRTAPARARRHESLGIQWSEVWRNRQRRGGEYRRHLGIRGTRHR